MMLRLVVKLFGGWWRLKTLCKQTKNRTLRRIALRVYDQHQNCCQSSIAWNSTFEGVPCFPHGIKSIFISGGGVIGHNCVIFQQVTIGSNTLSDSNGFGNPRIGNNCYIGAGAKIVGNVRLGDNVRVGANAVVYEDVPDNCVVVSGKQKTIAKQQVLDNRFYTCPGGQWMYFDDGRHVEVTDKTVLARLNRMAR